MSTITAPNFIDRIIEESQARGQARGRAEGEVRGRAEGEVRGRAEGEARSLLTILDARGIDISPELREQVETCDDHRQLQEWTVRAATATEASDVFNEGAE